MRKFLLLVAICLFDWGCQSNQYVTRDELRDLFAIAGMDSAVSNAGVDQAKLAAMVQEAMAAPNPDQRAAGALAAADAKTSKLADALAAIDRAMAICQINIANAGTTAYKCSRVVSNPAGAVAFRMDFTQGSLENTGRPMDLAIQGEGFFKVRTLEGGGFAYTRNGNFFINKVGDIVLGQGDGYALLPRITVPANTTEVTISQDGRVEVQTAGAASRKHVGQIALARFLNPDGLALLGGSLFIETNDSGPPREVNLRNGDSFVLQGILEGSNVDLGRERIRMKFLQNWREAVMKAVDASK